MTTGAWILVAAVVAAVLFGLWRRATDGRFRRRDPSVAAQSGPVVEEVAQRPSRDHAVVTLLTDLGATPGDRATLLQFSSAFCAPCRATRRVLAEVAEVVPGVAHVEVDAESHLDAVRRLGVARTPTTLVLDGSGREVTRAAGAPRKEQVIAALDQTLRD